ncbi:hypothetical protein [Anabaena lutea]|uniref:Uncharacterized protein n=1 Tax=Anabaena lutea FACHB-196 TaxID=2692881 RepID=A0ABR8FHK4_9NOST|nr:hypothetical protein [Anabaena lutea]MBD2569241.1 hypothetical protein [Anabaena lutea FACHB-196]
MKILLLCMAPIISIFNNKGGVSKTTYMFHSDYFIIPISPDLFSIRGTENLGSKLEAWRQGWEQCNNAWNNKTLTLPHGQPTFLGYVMQQHNIREDSEEKMTKGWQIFGNRIESAIQENIVNRLAKLDQVYYWPDGNFNLGKIPNLHSLIPYSLEAKKPVFDCTSVDGLRGAHISRARDSVEYFEPIAQRLLTVLNSHGFFEKKAKPNQVPKMLGFLNPTYYFFNGALLRDRATVIHIFSLSHNVPGNKFPV